MLLLCLLLALVGFLPLARISWGLDDILPIPAKLAPSLWWHAVLRQKITSEAIETQQVRITIMRNRVWGYCYGSEHHCLWVPNQMISPQ